METRVRTEIRLRATNLAQVLSFPPRLFAFPFVIVLQLAAAALGGIGFVLGNPAWALISGACLWALWFCGLFLIASKDTDRLLQRTVRWLAPSALSIFAVLAVLGVGEVALFATRFSIAGPSELIDAFHRGFSYNDATALSHQAADNLLAGKNPYSNGNVVTALLQHSGASDRVTPRREGDLASAFPYPTPAQLESVWQEALQNNDTPPRELETRMNYPAGAFELPAIFIWLGLKDLRWIYFIYAILGLAVAFWLCPARLRTGLAGILAISLAFWNSVASGETGSLAFPFMLLAWALARKSPMSSAVFMGAAVSVKQTAWFLAAFYLVLMLRTIGLKRNFAVASVVSGVFLASNIAFIVRDPALWISSMGAPMSHDFFPLGVGVVTLVTSGLVNIQTSVPFTLMEITVFGAGLVWYYLNCRRYPHTGPILAFLPLFFAWRSLWAYFFYIDIIVIAAVLIEEYGSDPAYAGNSVLRA